MSKYEDEDFDEDDLDSFEEVPIRRGKGGLFGSSLKKVDDLDEEEAPKDETDRETARKPAAGNGKMAGQEKQIKKHPLRKWGVALVIELLLVVGLGYGLIRTYAHGKYQEIGQVTDMSEEDLSINKGANKDMKGYTTIALFGIDARDSSLGEGNRSDAIMVASINKSTKEVKVVSVYRDTLMEIRTKDGDVTAKCNAAYAYGGPELAVQTLNQNLDLNISEYITVNWEGLTRAIDALGGVTVHIEPDELDTLNGVMAEQIQVNGIASDPVYETGDVTLNGPQATAYARIRSTGQGDITRTERQREVLSAMIAKAKKTDLGTLNKIVDQVLPYIGTSITESELSSMISAFFGYHFDSNTGFPFQYGFYNSASKGSCIAPQDLSENVRTLQQFLFGTTDYTPTENVQRISSALTEETGYGDTGAISLPTADPDSTTESQ